MLDGDYMVDDALTKESIQNADDAKATAVRFVQGNAGKADGLLAWER